jgi:tRNA A37 threonylcarbamoyladenosine dehydratase
MTAATDLDKRPLASMVRLYGQTTTDRIALAHVVVVGIGGVGSWAAEALARSGVGTVTLIDFDHISVSNINRQAHALHSTLGQSKVQAMKERMLAINPGLQVHAVDDFVTPENWAHLLPPDASAVIDCCDQFSAKLVMAQWAMAQPKSKRLPFVCVGAAGGKRLAHTVELGDLSETTHDPLLAKLRYTLRRQTRNLTDDESLRQSVPQPVRVRKEATSMGKPMGLSCVFSREALRPPILLNPLNGLVVTGTPQNTGGAALNCAGYGSVVTVTASFGFVAAGAILNELAASKMPTPIQEQTKKESVDVQEEQKRAL